MRVLLLCGLLLATLCAPPAAAQIRAESPAGRRVTTLDALTAFPGFYHLQPVRLRAKLVTDQVGTALIGGSTRLLTIGDAAVAHGDGDVEVLGTFIDVGRLTREDARVAQYDLPAVSQRVLGRDWPGQNELPLLLVTAVSAAEALAAPSIRAIAIDPARYEGQTVTVSGRFRGRNLFGDQPAAPGLSRHDFVLQLADASIWVVGRAPKGSGFELRVDARVDTGRWLEVHGTVKEAKGLVWIEASAIRLGKPVSEAPPVETEAEKPAPLPPPQVIFSTPTTDEVDVAPDARVRIQFSRDMLSQSFAGQVAARYEATPGDDAPEMGPFSFAYDAGRRVLELKFDQPFVRGQRVTIVLREGIVATDRQPLVPYTLRFTTAN